MSAINVTEKYHPKEAWKTNTYNTYYHYLPFFCHLVDFTVPANDGVKIKESEKIDKEMNEFWNMLAVIPVLLRTLEPIPKWLNKGLG